MFELINFLIVTPIINVLFVIYHFVGDFGVAVILFTIIIKMLTWPIMKRSLLQAKAMRKMQPELAEIKKRCKGNRQLETIQMLELNRKYNVKPLRSIFNLFIQIPIFISLFTAIQVMVSPTVKDNIALRAYPITLNLSTVKDLSTNQQEYLANHHDGKSYPFHPKLLNTFDLSVRAGFSDAHRIIILVFCLIAAYMQYLIAKQSVPKSKRTLKEVFKEAADGKEADQAEISAIVNGQMAKLMPLMMLSININFPGALVLYYMINNIIYYIQQKIIFKKDFDLMDNSADKAILKELKNVQEAKIINNKKSTNKHITRISAGKYKK